MIRYDCLGVFGIYKYMVSIFCLFRQAVLVGLFGAGCEVYADPRTV